jgi:hypothetical protein
MRSTVCAHCWQNHGFTIFVFVAAAITAMFALVFDASQEPIATLSILGILTAVAEYALGSGSEHQQRPP